MKRKYNVGDIYVNN
jgi:hypothetical protein